MALYSRQNQTSGSQAKSFVSSPAMPPELIEIVQNCVRRVSRWRVPPRWSQHEWLDEATAQGYASACEAWISFDGEKGACSSTFVQGRVMAGILTLYRREWTHTGRTQTEVADNSHHDDEGSARESTRTQREAGERRSKPRGPQASPNWERADLQQAIEKLSSEDQRLLRLVFWEERSEADIAQRLGISQPAVNKRKQSALEELRKHLKK